MKVVKTLYWMSFAFAFAQLALTLFGPFGGPMTIFHLIKRGMFEATNGISVLDLDYPPYNNVSVIARIRFFNSALTFTYFLGLFTCVLVPLLWQENTRNKYIAGIASFLTSVFVLTVGRKIWNYLVLTYV